MAIYQMRHLYMRRSGILALIFGIVACHATSGHATPSRADSSAKKSVKESRLFTGEAISEAHFLVEQTEQTTITLTRKGELLEVRDGKSSPFAPGAPSVLNVYGSLINRAPTSQELESIKSAASLEDILSTVGKLRRAELWAKRGDDSRLSDSLYSWGKARVREFASSGTASHREVELIANFSTVALEFEDYEGIIEVSAAIVGQDCKPLLLIDNGAGADSAGRLVALVVGAQKAVGKVEKALLLATSCAKNLPDSSAIKPYILTALGQALLAEGRNVEALAAYSKAIELAPSLRISASAYYWLAFDAFSSGNIKASRAFIQKLREVLGEPNDSFEAGLIKKATILEAELARAAAKRKKNVQ